jgi:hypothetical protein
MGGLLALCVLAACAARPGAVAGPTVSIGGGLSALSLHQR